MHVVHLAQVMHLSITTFVQEQTVRKINIGHVIIIRIELVHVTHVTIKN